MMNRSISGIQDIRGDSLTIGLHHTITSSSDLPQPQSGIIYLPAGSTWYFVGVIDLGNARLQAGNNVVILGDSSENSIITSNTSGALLTASGTIPIRNIALRNTGAGTILNLDAVGDPAAALDWFSVNFTAGNIGTIRNYNNVIFQACAFINTSQGITFSGSFATIGFNGCLIQSAGTAISLDAGCTITRRFRVIYSAIIALPGTIGITVDPAASLPTESFILDTVNFSGSGTYLGGLDYISESSLFTNNIGIINSASIGQMSMNNNATATTITGTNTFVKVAGITLPSVLNQKFSHTSNRLTYTGRISRFFKISAILTLTAGTNQNIQIALYKTNTQVAESVQTTNTAGSARSENIMTQCLCNMNQNDYYEVFVCNLTNNTNIVVSDLNLIITEVR